MASCTTPQTETAPVESTTPEPATTPTAIEPATTPTASDPPASAQRWLTLLRARHVEDLPGKEHVDGDPNAAEGLLWLAAHGNPLFVRVRAIALLEHVPSPAARDLLVETARNERAPVSLRTAAVQALAPYAQEPTVRSLLTALAGDDGVGATATDVLGVQSQ